MYSTQTANTTLAKMQLKVVISPPTWYKINRQIIVLTDYLVTQYPDVSLLCITNSRNPLVSVLQINVLRGPYLKLFSLSKQ